MPTLDQKYQLVRPVTERALKMRKRKKVKKWPDIGARNQNRPRNDPNVQDQRT